MDHQQCGQEEFNFESKTDKRVRNIIRGLESCTLYKVNIFPLSYEMKSAEYKFNTNFPVATPPQRYTVYLAEDNKTVHLYWTNVKCATGYKIQQEVAENEMETVWETKDVEVLSTNLQDQQPCVTYKYGEYCRTGFTGQYLGKCFVKKSSTHKLGTSSMNSLSLIHI